MLRSACSSSRSLPLRARAAGGRPALVRFATERIERFDHGFPKASIGALYQGITATPRDWVDAAVGRNADVAFVFSGQDKTHHPDTLWENEFYNRSIGPVYDLRQPSMGGLPETKVTERADGVLLADGKPVRHRYVLSEESVPLAGAVVARDELRAWRCGARTVSCASATACRASTPMTPGPASG